MIWGGGGGGGVVNIDGLQVMLTLISEDEVNIDLRR